MARRSGELSGSILGRWESPFVFAVAVTFLMLIGSVYVTAPQPATAVPSRTVTVDPGGALLAQARASLAAGNGPAMGPSSLPGNGSVAATWLNVVPTSTSTPAERYLGMMEYDPVDHYVLLFGGSNTTTTSITGSVTYSDTWTYAGGHWTQIFPNNSPSARYLGGMTWDAKDGYMVEFGGHSLVGTSTSLWFNDTWEFINGQWSNITGLSSAMPSPRWRFGMAYDAADGYTVLFGGTDSLGNPLNDTWKFVGGVWTDITKKVTGNPPARYRAPMVYDPANGYIVEFGGCTSTALVCGTSDTWTFLNRTWTHLALVVHPSNRIYSQMAYDPALGYVVLYAGAVSSSVPGGAMRDTWSFNGTWTNLSSKLTTSPSYRAFEMMAFDGLDNYTLLFGGQNANTAAYLGDTWSYGPALLATASTSPPVIDVGQTSVINVTAVANSAGLNYTYLALPPGCASSNLSLLPCQPNQTGNFSIQANVSTPARQNASAFTSLIVNYDPNITSFQVSPATVTSGGSIQFSVAAVNGTSPYAYVYSGLPRGCTSRNVAILVCQPTQNQSFTVEVAVRDAAGWTVYANASLLVNPKPSIASFVAAPKVIDTGQWTNLTVSFRGGTAPFNFSYSGLPPGCTPGNSPVVPCHASTVGGYTASVRITDSYNFSANASVNVTINPAPTIQEFNASALVIDAGQAVTFYLNASGGTGILNYSYSSAIVGCRLAPTTPASCTPNAPGNFTVTATVTDGVNARVTASLTLTVNAAPSIAAATASPAAIDVHQNLTVTVTPAGGTLPYTYTYSGLPTGCPLTRSSTFSCTPTQPGSPTIAVVVTDHWGRTASGSILVTITPDPTIRLFNATPNSTFAGNSATLAVSVSGGSGVYSYSYGGLPASCDSVNRSTLTCATAVAGFYNVTVTVTDSFGVSVSAKTLLVVQTPPPKPGTGSTVLGLSSSTGYLVILLLVLLVVAAVVALLLMRRRGRASEEPPPAEEEVVAEPQAEWSEDEGPGAG